ncbi:hypothetical protein B0H17DRAFT_1148792 [Mycena rosella]|uniref:Uncharacterized protein n=1 Tax=Mycena rosella TaxID=1033263 RepID=A0AAD7CBF3_MYCRO|nr:hypothetical protein B0H17DRAFT_1148792 [Mycena rosella]
MSNPQQMWVRSPKGVYYWRDPTGSVWKGPHDDCIWVPSQDSPAGMPPPPTDFAEQPGDPAPTPPSMGAAHNFGSLAPLPHLQNTRAFPPTGFGAPRPAHQGASIPATQRPHGPMEYQGYTGSFAMTMRYRDEVATCGGSSNPAVHRDNGYRSAEPPRYEQGCRDNHRRDNHCCEDHRRNAARATGARNTAAICATTLLGPWAPLNAGIVTPGMRPQSGAKGSRTWVATWHGGDDTQPGPTVAHRYGPPRTSHTPDLAAAPRDTAGHPQFPIAPVPDDESDWGASEDESTDKERRNLKKFEHARRPTGTIPDVPTTRGRARMVATTGDPTPQSQHGTTKTRNQRRREKKRGTIRKPPGLESDGATVMLPMDHSPDVHMPPPESDDEGPFQQSYAGSSPLPMVLYAETRGPEMVMLGQWEYAELPLEHDPFDATNITMSQAFAWAYTHGIKPGLRAAAQLHDYAQSWRNARHNLAGGNKEFGDFPRNARGVLSVDMPSITSWRTLYYGPPRTGVNTSMPSTSSQGHMSRPPPAITPAVDSKMAPADNMAAPTSVTDVEAGEIVPMEVPLPESPVRNSPHSPDKDLADVTSDKGPTSMAPKTDTPA